MTVTAAWRPRLYISGPMTGYPDSNYPKFRQAAKAIRAAGWDVIDPSEHFEGRRDLPRHKFLAADVYDLITKCRGIVLLEKWYDAEGSLLEAQIAFDQGYCFYDWLSPAWPILPADMNEVREALSFAG